MNRPSTLFSLQQAQAWLQSPVLVGDGLTPVLRVHTDTRTLRPGDLFVALRGEKFDGHGFLKQARQAGAVAALSEDAAMLREAGMSGLIVADTRAALGELSAAWRRQFELPLIAVTGSNGKTTVTQMIASILRAHRPEAMLATEGNFNNEIGVPLTLLRLRSHHEIAVLELGMNHPGEIARLGGWAQPTVALVNNAQREHQEFLNGVEAVARENGAVIQALGPKGTAVFPADDQYCRLWQELAGARSCLRFALKTEGSGVEVHAPEADWTGTGWSVRAATPVGELRYVLRVAGAHNLRNSLAALSCALAAGVPPAAIVQGLEAFEPVSGRSRMVQIQVPGGLQTLVDDTYNANPDSVRAAIDVLAHLPGPRLLVLGDMGEVGEQGPQFHAEIGAYAQERGIDQVYALGELSRHTVAHCRTATHFQDVGSLNAALLCDLRRWRSILVKGSRFMRMERVVQALVASQAETAGESHAA